MDATILTAGGWEALLDSLERLALLGGLAPLVALAVTALVTALFRPAQHADTHEWGEWRRERRPVAGTGQGPRGALDAPGTAVVLAATAARPDRESVRTVTVARGLVRLSPAEVVALGALRERILTEASEAPVAPERLAFARWLVEQGRLSG